MLVTWVVFQVVIIFLWYTPISVGQYFIAVALLSYFSTAFLLLKCSRLILYSSCPIPRISHFLKELLFFLVGNDIRNQLLASGCTHCYWGIIASSISRLGEKENIYVHIFIDICISINSSICNHLSYINIKLNMNL